MKTSVLHKKAAKQITEIENRTAAGKKILKALSKTKKRARVVGITGPFGCGKSTLINTLVAKLRNTGKKIGVLAVDPSSPKTGGALLGDRIRMQSHALDKNIFIRSFATRGAYGGISGAISGAIKIMDNIGKDIIFVETTGAGQVETAVSDVVDVVVLVMTPDETDDIQMLKAGITEIADIVAVNKMDISDLSVSRKVENILGVPVIEISALENTGIDRLWKQVLNHGRKLNV